MTKTPVLLLFAATFAFGQYKLEPAGAPPEGLPPALATTLQKQGSRILNAGGTPVCEVWLRESLPAGSKSEEQAVAFPTIPHGALLGVIRFTNPGSDRRGQTLKPGLYTMRYSIYPVDGAHQGVAPQRDFALLVPLAEDKDPATLPAYDPLVEMSRKASGTPHPAVLALEPATGDTATPSFEKVGDKDWVLHGKIGGQPVGIILIGTFEG